MSLFSRFILALTLCSPAVSLSACVEDNAEVLNEGASDSGDVELRGQVTILAPPGALVSSVRVDIFDREGQAVLHTFEPYRTDFIAGARTTVNTSFAFSLPAGTWYLLRSRVQISVERDGETVNEEHQASMNYQLKAAAGATFAQRIVVD